MPVISGSISTDVKKMMDKYAAERYRSRASVLTEACDHFVNTVIKPYNERKDKNVKKRKQNKKEDIMVKAKYIYKEHNGNIYRALVVRETDLFYYISKDSYKSASLEFKLVFKGAFKFSKDVSCINKIKVINDAIGQKKDYISSLAEEIKKENEQILMLKKLKAHYGANKKKPPKR